MATATTPTVCLLHNWQSQEWLDMFAIVIKKYWTAQFEWNINEVWYWIKKESESKWTEWYKVLTLGCLQKSGLLKYTTQQTPTPKIGLVSYFMIKNLQNMCFWSKFCFSHKNNQHIYNYQACGVLFLVLHVCVENCLRSRVNESSGLDSVHSTNTLPWRVHQSSQFLRIFDIREI